MRSKFYQLSKRVFVQKTSTIIVSLLSLVFPLYLFLTKTALQVTVSTLQVCAIRQ